MRLRAPGIRLRLPCSTTSRNTFRVILRGRSWPPATGGDEDLPQDESRLSELPRKNRGERSMGMKAGKKAFLILAALALAGLTGFAAEKDGVVISRDGRM